MTSPIQSGLWILFTATMMVSPQAAAAETALNTTFSFSREHVIVWFNPYVSRFDQYDSYDESGLLVLISKVFTRFSKIMVGEIFCSSINDPRLPTYSIAQVPSTVAKFNKFLRPNGSAPMEVYLVFEFFPPWNDTSKTNFDVIKALADNANSIYPGTVTTLVFISLTRISYNVAQFHLNYARDQLLRHHSHNQFSYKLGLQTGVEDCGGKSSSSSTSTTTVAQYVAELVPSLDVLFLSYLPEPDRLILTDMEVVLARFQKDFKRCVGKLRKLRTPSQLTIGAYSQWSDRDGDGDGVVNASSLVSFWESVAGWGERENMMVTLVQAFDTPWKDTFVKRSCGWWSLVENGTESYGNASDYVFQEKWDLVASTQKRSIVSDGGGLSSWWIVVPIILVSGVVILVVVVMMAAVVVVVYTRNKTSNPCALGAEEVRGFFDGGSMSYVTPPGDDLNLSDDEIWKWGIGTGAAVAYDPKLEVKKEDFTIEEGKLLGAGEFGKVVVGRIRRDSSERVKVAVKMGVRIQDSSGLVLKGLLSEIKVLSYVGKHDNIVKLEGAYTAELSKGNVLVFLEYCSLGSLLSHLRSYSNNSRCVVNLGKGKPTQNDYTYVSTVVNHPTESELLRWSVEIASAMEYLTEKRVVHADLATRNILLTGESKTVKLSDFGLSRKLYNYVSYVKGQQEPLPWRWMSPESLKRLVFNEKTDVWAYGVTMWEIYSLGDVPYSGLGWSPDFASKLGQGLRLQMPQHSTSSPHLFSVMEECWNFDPMLRPTFRELKFRLNESQYTQM